MFGYREGLFSSRSTMRSTGTNASNHVLVRHEQGAVHAAEGYARSTGKPGVVLVTSGPGATNSVTGLTDALMDSIPVVLISGQVPTFMIGNDAFQEADTVGITRPCTKHNWLVKDTNLLADTSPGFQSHTGDQNGAVDVRRMSFAEGTTARRPTGHRHVTANWRALRRDRKVGRWMETGARPIIYSAAGSSFGSGGPASSRDSPRKGISDPSLDGPWYLPCQRRELAWHAGMHGSYEANLRSGCDL